MALQKQNDSAEYRTLHFENHSRKLREEVVKSVDSKYVMIVYIFQDFHRKIQNPKRKLGAGL